MKITIDDVARKAKVSKTTVSRILNGNYEHTSEKTRQKVLKVIEELNYRPNPFAKGLKQLKSNVFGIVLSNLKNPFWIEVLEGVEDTFRKQGYQLMICNSNEDAVLEADNIQSMLLRQVDGLLINPTARQTGIFHELMEKNYPFVVLNRKIPGIHTHAVLIDNKGGAALAVEHLLRLGKTKIAIFVFDLDHVSSWQERVLGYQEALLRNGFSEKDFMIYRVNTEEGSVRKETVRMLKKSRKPDAILSTNNMMTLEILDGIRECGLRIPNDIALVSYDETVWAKHLDITTVQHNGYEMGKAAAEKLIRQIGSERKNEPEITMIEPCLMIRQSCGSNMQKKEKRVKNGKKE